jgi:hypothetical protein
LAAAIASLAAVFAIQRIEASGGPLAEPYGTQFFSPNGDGLRDEAEIRFNAHGEHRATIRVLNADGDVVRTLFRDRRVRGPKFYTWDGRTDHGEIAPDGTYTFEISLDGGRRTYSPSVPTVLDTSPVRVRLDRPEYRDGVLTGLLVTNEPKLRLYASTRDAEDPAAAAHAVPGMRIWTPNAGTVSGRPTKPARAGEAVLRFAVPLADPSKLKSLFAEDRAENRTSLHLALVARLEPGPIEQGTA